MKKFKNDSSNVRISLNSSVKKKDYGNIYTINEEDNESYDSLSLQKSLKNSKKVKPSKLDIKKNTIKEIRGMFNNSNNDNYDSNGKEIPDISMDNIIQKNKKNEEIQIGNNDDDIEDKEDNEDFIINDIDNDLSTNINYNIKNNNKNGKLILSIDLDMNLNNINNINKKDNIKEEKKEDEYKENNEIILDNVNEKHQEREERDKKENLLYLNNSQSKEKPTEKKF